MKKLFLPVFLIILYLGLAMQVAQAGTYGENLKIIDTAISEHSLCYDEYGERTMWCSTAEERELTWLGKGFWIIILLVVMLKAFSMSPLLVGGLFVLAIILIIGNFIINLSLITWIILFNIFVALFFWGKNYNKLEKECLKSLLSYEYNDLMVLMRYLNIGMVYGESIVHQKIKNTEIVQHVSNAITENQINLCKELNNFDSKRERYNPPEGNNAISISDVENFITKSNPSFYKLRNLDLRYLVSDFGGYPKSNDKKINLQKQVYEASAFWINNSVYGDVNDPNKKYWDNFLSHMDSCHKVLIKHAKIMKEKKESYYGAELHKDLDTIRQTYY